MTPGKLQPNTNTFYFITFTCFEWISLFEITDLYNYIYECFDHLELQKIYHCGYVIMPNHLHMLVYMANTEKTINKIIGESKRFMAYEIVNRLKKLRRLDLLNLLGESVTQHERRKKKKHNVFRPSEDIKEIMTEKFIRQKLNYMHKNPVSGKWKLVENYLDYIHSSARFYELGEEGVFHVYHYQEINNPAEFPPQ